MSGILTIELRGPRMIVCAGCSRETADEGYAVSINDCGEATTEDTGQCRAACKAFYDAVHGPAGVIWGCAAVTA